MTAWGGWEKEREKRRDESPAETNSARGGRTEVGGVRDERRWMSAEGVERDGGEEMWGDVSSADGLREHRSKFHAVMSPQMQEM